jgi:hypothetical protein
MVHKIRQASRASREGSEEEEATRAERVKDVPEDDGRGHAELDEYFLDVLVEGLLVEIPGGLIVGGGPGGRVGGAAVRVNRARRR